MLKLKLIILISYIVMIANSLSTGTQRIVILGGGIHGVSLAYYLAEKGVAATLVERKEIAAAASGIVHKSIMYSYLSIRLLEDL
jgi:glycine/D-amino acid oxidase-like deaminating enzyme